MRIKTVFGWSAILFLSFSGRGEATCDVISRTKSESNLSRAVELKPFQRTRNGSLYHKRQTLIPALRVGLVYGEKAFWAAYECLDSSQKGKIFETLSCENRLKDLAQMMVWISNEPSSLQVNGKNKDQLCPVADNINCWYIWKTLDDLSMRGKLRKFLDKLEIAGLIDVAAYMHKHIYWKFFRQTIDPVLNRTEMRKLSTLSH